MTAEELFLYMQKIRRELHASPCLSWEEEETAELIERELREMGIAARRVEKTGVLADIPSYEGAPVIALRADTDALPIQEATGLSFASTKPGIMHACGHDMHTAILLGTAKRILETDPAKRPHVLLIFQPAEEFIEDSGAPRMLPYLKEAGVQAVFGLHVWNELPVGEYSLVEGPCMAAADTFDLTFRGKGAHGAQPQNSVDPVWMSALFTVEAQALISRGKAPIEPGVLSICCIHGGEAKNVIPSSVTLSGTVRTISEATRSYIEKGIRERAEALALSHGGSIEFAYHRGTYPAHNDETLVRKLLPRLEKVFGEGKNHSLPVQMEGEDFSFYQHSLPGVFLHLGARVEGKPSPRHSSEYEIHEGCMPCGTDAMMSFLQLWEK